MPYLGIDTSIQQIESPKYPALELHIEPLLRPFHLRHFVYLLNFYHLVIDPKIKKIIPAHREIIVTTRYTFFNQSSIDSLLYDAIREKMPEIKKPIQIEYATLHILAGGCIPEISCLILFHSCTLIG